MNHLFRAIALAFVGLLALALIVGVFADTGAPQGQLSVSELVTRINAAAVKKISVDGDRLTITAGDGASFRARKETGVSVFETLKNAGAAPEKVAAVDITVKEPSSARIALETLLPIVLPLLLVLGVFWFMYRQAQRGSAQAFSFGKSKAKLAQQSPADKKIRFKDVAGLIEAKEEVSEVVEFLRDPEKFHRLGARIPRGILLVGAPGTGKTLLAKAVANEARVPFFYVSGSEFVEMFVGVGANRVRDTFETAKMAGPAIIFIDEIDAVGRQRGTGIGGGHDEREQTLNQILVEMDGFEGNDAVIVMAATNRPDILDPALLRPGRFDRRIILDEPSLNDREAILGIHATGKPMAAGVQLRVVAERTPGFSGADLANLINEAAILAARKGQREITQENLLESIEKVMLGPERRSHVLSLKEKEITAFHEGGHALVAASLEHADPVHKISIISRGRAGGYTLKLPTQDKYLKTRSEYMAELAVLLGGYMAEKIVFNELTTGASNDLKVASDLARRMVTMYGMTDTFGPIAFGDHQEALFLGRELTHNRNYSETVAYQIDQEVARIMQEASAAASRAITEQQETLTRIARKLQEVETLEQADFYALIGKPVPASNA